MGFLRRLFQALSRRPPVADQEPSPWDERSRFNLPQRQPELWIQPSPSVEAELRIQPPPENVKEHKVFRGRCWVIDGDTIVIDKVHIRLSGIDAPELDHPLGQKAKWALHALCKGQVITARTDGSVSHERAVATCHLPDGRDLSAEMVKAGFALDWSEYSGGRYRHLEPEGARKKLWRTNARQRGGKAQLKAED